MTLRLLFATVFASLCLMGESSTLYDRDDVVEAGYVADFACDGDFTKSVWTSAPKVKALRLHVGGVNGSAEPYSSDIRLLYSKTALYIGAYFRQPMDVMLARYDQNDQPVFSDDNVEIFLNLPGEESVSYCHFAVNPLGTNFDEKNGNKNWWVEGRRTLVKRTADGWMMEVKLPFGGLGIGRQYYGDSLGIRFCRTVHRPKMAVSSYPLLADHNHQSRSDFAKLAFLAPAGADAAALRAEADAARKSEYERRYDKLLRETEELLSGLEASRPLFAKKQHPVYAAAEVEVKRMSSALATFKKTKGGDYESLKALAKGFRKTVDEASYVVWPVDKWAGGSPKDLPPESVSHVPLLKFEQAGNEREAVCLTFAGLLCGPRLDLRIVPENYEVKDPKRLCIPGDCFEIYEEPYIHFDGRVLTAPLLKRPGNIITLTPGHPVRVWIVFNSRDVRPGNYPMTIKLKSAYDREIADREMRAEVKVWRFALPETHDWPMKSFFWGPAYCEHDEAQVLELLHGRHVTHGWTRSQCLYSFGGMRGVSKTDWYKPNPDKKKYPLGFDPEIARTANQKFFDTAKRLRMRFVFGWGTPYAPEWFQLMSDRLTGMGFDYSDFIFKSLIRDEFQKADIPQLASARAKVTAWPGSDKWWFQNVYLSTPPPSGATMDDIEAAKLPEFYRQWTVIHKLLKDPDRGPDVIRRLRAKGCEVWSYNCEICMQRRPILGYYRLWLWDCYLMGLDGAAMWTYGVRSGSDGFDSRDGFDDGVLWQANDGEMVPTVRFEAFSEGLEDVAYMDALKKAQRKLKAAGKAEDEEVSLLLGQCRSVQKANSQSMLDAWRLAAGRALDRLAGDGL